MIGLETRSFDSAGYADLQHALKGPFAKTQTYRRCSPWLENVARNLWWNRDFEGRNAKGRILFMALMET